MNADEHHIVIRAIESLKTGSALVYSLNAILGKRDDGMLVKGHREIDEIKHQEEDHKRRWTKCACCPVKVLLALRNSDEVCSILTHKNVQNRATRSRGRDSYRH